MIAGFCLNKLWNLQLGNLVHVDKALNVVRHNSAGPRSSICGR